MTVSEPRTATGRTAEWRWSLLLPPNWVTLPVEAEAGRTAVRRLLDRQMAHLPRDRVAPARRRMEGELRSLLTEARQAGATTLHAHVGLVRGVPVSATCAVSLVRGVAVEASEDLVAHPVGHAELYGVIATDGHVELVFEMEQAVVRPCQR